MKLSNFAAYIAQLWRNKPDTSTPLSAERLRHIEDGIKGNSDAIEAIAAAVVNQIVNDPDKIASMAALYAVNQKVSALDRKVGDTAQLPDGATDVVTAITKQNSDFGSINNKFCSSLDYIDAAYQRVRDINNSSASTKILNDLTYMIQTQKIYSGGFGFANIKCADKPTGASNWGYIEFFKHADNYVTVKYYQDGNTKVYIGQFILGESNWKIVWS